VTGTKLVLAVYLSKKPVLDLLLQPSLERLFDLEGIFSLHDQTVVQRDTISTHLELFYACKNTQIWKYCHYFLKMLQPSLHPTAICMASMMTSPTKAKSVFMISS
jgi:hypothetical protein